MGCSLCIRYPYTLSRIFNLISIRELISLAKMEHLHQLQTNAIASDGQWHWRGSRCQLHTVEAVGLLLPLGTTRERSVMFPSNRPGLNIPGVNIEEELARFTPHDLYMLEMESSKYLESHTKSSFHIAANLMDLLRQSNESQRLYWADMYLQEQEYLNSGYHIPLEEPRDYDWSFVRGAATSSNAPFKCCWTYLTVTD